MRVLIACEYSGTVRNAFGKLGHTAISCDIIPGERYLFEDSFGVHVTRDVLEVMGPGYDLMIAHPPCTYLSFAGNRHWFNPGRAEKREAALKFFFALYNAPIERICIENPMGVPHKIIACSQIVDPSMFGDAIHKRTCLWLKNLPLLVPTDLVEVKSVFFGSGLKMSGIDRLAKGVGNGPARRKARSKFFPGMAAAMADQWGVL